MAMIKILNQCQEGVFFMSKLSKELIRQIIADGEFSTPNDIGKANAKTIDENGRIHFKGHEKFSGEIAIKVGKNLNLSQKSIKLLYNYTRYHMYLLSIYKRSNASHDVLKEMFDKLEDDIIGIMLLGFADITATMRLIEPREDEEILKTYIYYVLTIYIYKYKKNVSY